MNLDSFILTVQNQLQSYWFDYLDGSSWHPTFKELAKHRVGQGKCLRPALIVKTYQTLKETEALPPAHVWKTALALELIHTYSLVHDDLPCMDDDNFRRGLPTAHRESNEATALLLGDALLTAAFEVLATADCPADSRINLIQKLAHFAGGAGMVSGQQRDLFGEDGNVEALKVLHEEKTGALFSYCVWAGALHALPKSSFQSSEKTYLDFGKKLGLLFQVVDDVLDAGEEGASFVKFMGLDETNNFAARLAKELNSDAVASGLTGLSPIIDRFLDRKT